MNVSLPSALERLIWSGLATAAQRTEPEWPFKRLELAWLCASQNNDAEWRTFRWSDRYLGPAKCQSEVPAKSCLDGVAGNIGICNEDCRREGGVGHAMRQFAEIVVGIVEP